MVQLGEPSHGAGGSFAAKVRLIKFLHQRMGFDVLAWESGLYDLQLTQAGVRAGENAVAAAQRGIFAIWSATEEVRPLFEYAKASQATTRPLDMAGFDMQISVEKFAERFAADLRAFVRGLRDPALRDRTSELAIENMRGNDTNVYDRQRPDRPAGSAASALYNEGWNRRDALNASNLRWLIQNGYTGRKIIVWAHNVHMMNAYYAADLHSIHLEPQPGGLEPSGVLLAKWLNDEVYTIAMTNYEGKDGWDSASPIAPAAEGSLESRLHKLGKPYVFLDFRALDGSPGHPLHKPQSMRIDKYRDDTLTDVTRAFDAVFYIDRMAPATRIRHTRDGSGPS